MTRSRFIKVYEVRSPSKKDPLGREKIRGVFESEKKAEIFIKNKKDNKGIYTIRESRLKQAYFDGERTD